MKVFLDKFKTLYCVGDCFTAGQDTERKYGYPYFLQLLLGEGYFVENLGRANLQVRLVLEHPDLFVPDIVATKALCIIWCGSNDIYLNNGSVEDIFKSYLDLYSSYKDREVDCLHLTIFPRRGTPLISEKDFESKRKELNKRIMDEFPDSTIDIGNDKTLTRNAHYGTYLRNYHLTYKGFKYVAVKLYDHLKEKGF